MSEPKIRFQIDNYLVIPFGCPKYDIEKIKIVGVSPYATYFESEVPCARIDKEKKVALRLSDFRSVSSEEIAKIDDDEEAFACIKSYLKKKCDSNDQHEGKFLDIYFEYCRRKVQSRLERAKKAVENNNMTEMLLTRLDRMSEAVSNATSMLLHNQSSEPWDFIRVFDALLPLPQAHFYVHDPLDMGKANFNGVPRYMSKTDFAFWTGERIVAIEIDSPHKNLSEVIPRRRRLEKAGIEVINVLHKEITEKLHDPNYMEALVPCLANFSREEARKGLRHNPLSSKV